ncbi:AAA+ family ATPase [Mycobacteroides abscessus subsp. massiliense]|nr:AAA+ family ATPase [Mycobacteroides abscessus subsp. massiliense]
MMTARQHFALGIEALGLSSPIPGYPLTLAKDATEQQRAAARPHFQRAVDADPAMCDAWVGLACAGDVSVSTLTGAHENSTFLHRETRRLGLEDTQLYPAVPAPIDCINLYPCTHTGLALARIAAVIRAHDYDLAEKLLDTVHLAPEPHQAQIHRLLGASLYYVTEQWPAVLDWTCRSVSVIEPEVDEVTALMTGVAQARLGRVDEAVATLATMKPTIPQVAAESALFLGLCERARQDEKRAHLHLQKAVVGDVRLSEAAAALADPTYGLLTTTVDAIAARSNRWDPRSGPSVVDLAREKRRAGDPEMLARAEARIDAYVGLAPVKERLHQLKIARQYDAMMLAAGEEVGEMESLNMSFVGAPGTAKTSMARDVGEEYCGLGLLAKPDVVEASRATLIGEHIGVTASRTLAFLEQAKGGVALVDEAPELYKPHTPNDFGIEALDTIMKWTEDNRDNTMVILAGYKGPLNAMLDHNVGMRSRFPVQLEFPSYTGEEMLEILTRMAASRSKVLLDDDSGQYWLKLCTYLYEAWSSEDENAGPRGEPGGPRRLIDIAANGRFARMVLTEAALLMKNRVTPTLDTTTPEGLRRGRTVITADLREATRRTLLTQRLDPSIADIA